jgi:formate C-acetyltransferase
VALGLALSSCDLLNVLNGGDSAKLNAPPAPATVDGVVNWTDGDSGTLSFTLSMGGDAARFVDPRLVSDSNRSAVGITDAADSLYAINELVFKQKKYSLLQIIKAIDDNFAGEENQKIRADLLAIPKFGEDGKNEAAMWVTKVMEIYNNALDSVPYATRNGNYTAGYYALNVNDIYGKRTQALPSGRLKGVPLANSITPHYGMEQADLLSALNSKSEVNFTDFAVNGATATLTIDSALFPGEGGISNLASIFKTFLTTGGMQLQPNVVSRALLLEAYEHPEKHPYLMVRVAGYCAYFQELSDELKRIIINRTCYS